MSQQTLEAPAHVFAAYTVVPTPTFPAPDEVSHRENVQSLTEAIETGQRIDTPARMGGYMSATGTGTATGSAPSDSDSDSDTDWIVDS